MKPENELDYFLVITIWFKALAGPDMNDGINGYQCINSVLITIYMFYMFRMISMRHVRWCKCLLYHSIYIAPIIIIFHLI